MFSEYESLERMDRITVEISGRLRSAIVVDVEQRPKYRVFIRIHNTCRAGWDPNAYLLKKEQFVQITRRANELNHARGAA